jgi:hypothetical protein
MFTTNFMKAGAAVAAVAGLLSLGVTSAEADPSSTKLYNGVGSDTIQDVWNDLANTGGALAALNFGSWDANPQNTNITTVSGGTTFLRPTGSGNGVKALSAAVKPATCSWLRWDSATSTTVSQTLTNADVSFARSSSGPALPGGNDLTYIPFARDAVSVAYTPGAGETAVTFSRDELQKIYGGPTIVNPATTISFDPSTGLPIKGGNILHPYLPQSGSGTRSFFLGSTGINVGTVASYVDQSSSYLENRGGVISATTRALIPFSAAQWIYQQHTGGATDTTGGLLIADIDEDNNASISSPPRTAVTGTGSSAAPGTLYGGLTAPPTATDPFARDTYNVVATSEKNATLGARLKVAAGVGASSAAANARTTLAADGFGVIDAYAGTEAVYAYPTSSAVAVNGSAC